MSRCTHQFTRGSFEPVGVTGGVAVVRYRATCAHCDSVVAQFDRSERLCDSDTCFD
jgi:hypothetical protein